MTMMTTTTRATQHLKLLALIGAICTSAAWADPFDFKGLKLGTARNDVSEAHRLFYCQAPSSTALYDEMCAIAGPIFNTVAEVAVKDPVIAGFLGGKLFSLSFTIAAGSYSEVFDAVVARYGAPFKHSEEPFQTRGGLKAVNAIAVWRQGDSTITLRKYGGSIDTGSIIYSLETDAAEYRRRKESEARSRSKDM
jgi:hypothetical protein